LITSIKVNYEEVEITDTLRLEYDDRTVTFEFASPDFRNQDKIQYAFQLEGYDNEWHNVLASSRTASFTNLPFGSYSFKVRVRVGNADWQKTFLSIPVQAIPPFWLKPWFILLEVMAGIGLIVLIVRYYSQRKLRQQLREAETQKKIHVEKERISRDLHDNVGSHLTYIITSLDNMSYKIEKGEKNVPPDKISSLSDFSRSTMQQLRETIWAINKEHITLTELKEKIGEYSSRMASANNMSFHIGLTFTANRSIKPSHAINIYRVVQEAVNNSVKHSEAKSILISIQEEENGKIALQVKDNGKGMNATDASSGGYGLKNMQDRVKDMQGEILIDSDENGTKINFIIPI
jgi:signal transduction histidine kinase